MVGKVKLALLGCGDVAQRDYLPEMHRLADRVELVAVCGRSPQRARHVAEAYGIPSWYTDYARMLREAEVDAVLNLTPIQLHAEATLACLAAGKHVYSEKPVATELEDALRIREEASRRGLVVVCAPSVMLFPQVRYVQRLLERGAVGEVHLVHARGYGGVPPWRGYTSDPTPFFAPGGGPLMDMGVYPLHVLTGLFGPVRKVAAMSHRSREAFVVDEGPFAGKLVPIAVDDCWELVLEMEVGVTAVVSANNCVVDTRSPEMEIYGLDGTIGLSLLDVSAPVALLRRGGGWESLKVDHGGRAQGPDHLLGVEHLVDCITSGTPPILSLQQAIHVLEVIKGAERSAASGYTQQLA